MIYSHELPFNVESPSTRCRYSTPRYLAMLRPGTAHLSEQPRYASSTKPRYALIRNFVIDKTCTTHDVIAVTSAGQNDRRSYRSAVHRGRMHTTENDETIERDLTLAPGMSSVGPTTASLRSQEDARPARTTRSFGADSASDDGVDSQ